MRFVQSWRADAHGRLLIWAALYFLLLVVVNVVVNFGTNFTVLRLAYYWLLSPQTVEQSADSWRVMLAALRWLQSGAEDGTLYQEIFFERRMKFQYPPTSLLPLSALEALGAAPTPPLLNAIGRIVIGMTVCAMGALAWILAGRAGWALERRIGAAVLAGGSIFFLFPVMYPYQIGQIQVWMTFAFILAAISWLLDRRAAAGVCIGLICMIKPQLGLFALWALWRREWRMLGGLVATCLAGGLLSIWAYGIHNHFAYFEPLAFMARHGEAYAANQSFDGLLHRLLGDDNPAVFEVHGFPPYRPAVYFGTLATTAAILVFAFWGRARAPNQRPLVDFLLAGLAFTIASPIAWEFHYGLIAPIFVALFFAASAMNDARRRRTWLVWLAILFGVAGTGPFLIEARAMGPFNLALSYLLYAGLALLAMLWLLNRRTFRA